MQKFAAIVDDSFFAVYDPKNEGEETCFWQGLRLSIDKSNLRSE